ncbi:hypothetical protein GWI33_022989 [Rhynchophorus ferrugineus]|uniref:Uncharacterized protein n=1 Tax=Rhynchophorus ferrugineus TaxID=354439 RepID=A0A834MH39_RHYFE|nr:hypothetical protein GWI33_022989 [Rhynchophorus ferrugineus]
MVAGGGARGRHGSASAPLRHAYRMPASLARSRPIVVARGPRGDPRLFSSLLVCLFVCSWWIDRVLLSPPVMPWTVG